MSDGEEPQNDSPVEEPKYLIAEDNHVNQAIFGKMFDKLGLKYQRAWNGLEAVDMYKAHPERCRIILMDLSMPEMSGMDATESIREHERANSLQPAVIVGLSAHMMEEDNKKYLGKNKMNAILKKPFDLGRLEEVIDNWPV